MIESLARFLFEISGRFLGSPANFLMCNDAKKESIKQLIDDGAMKIKAKLYDEAIKCFEEGIRLDPKSLGAHLAMIEGLRAKGKDLEALSEGGFALALADSSLEKKTVYLSLGSTALDTFKLSFALDHANQSLGFYQLALKEDPTELRAMWNLVETHIEVFCADRLDEDIRMEHRKEMQRGLAYLNEALTGQNNASLARLFVKEGERIQKRLSERAMSVLEFNEGLDSLRMHEEAWEDLQNLQRIVDSSDDNGKGFRRKVLAYVMAAVFFVSGVLLSVMSVAEAAETSQIETGQVEYTRSQPTEVTPRIDQVFVLEGNDELEVATVDLDWDEMKRLATVDPDWEEIKKLV